MSIPIVRIDFRIFLSHPIKDKAELESRYEIISFLIKSENEIVVKNLKGCLKHISNVSVSFGLKNVIQTHREEGVPGFPFGPGIFKGPLGRVNFQIFS